MQRRRPWKKHSNQHVLLPGQTARVIKLKFVGGLHAQALFPKTSNLSRATVRNSSTETRCHAPRGTPSNSINRRQSSTKSNKSNKRNQCNRDHIAPKKRKKGVQNRTNTTVNTVLVENQGGKATDDIAFKSARQHTRRRSYREDDECSRINLFRFLQAILEKAPMDVCGQRVRANKVHLVDPTTHEVP